MWNFAHKFYLRNFCLCHCLDSPKKHRKHKKHRHKRETSQDSFSLVSSPDGASVTSPQPSIKLKIKFGGQTFSTQRYCRNLNIPRRWIDAGIGETHLQEQFVRQWSSKCALQVTVSIGHVVIDIDVKNAVYVFNFFKRIFNIFYFSNIFLNIQR